MFHTHEKEIVDSLLVLGWAEEVRAGHGDRAREEARRWLDRAIAEGLPASGEPPGSRRFDAELTLRFLRERGLAGLDPLWRERVLPAKRRALADYVDAQRPEGTAHQPRRITVFFERTTVWHDVPPGRTVKSALPLPEEEETQRDLVVSAIEETGARLRREPGALVRVGPLPADRTVRIGAHISFTATWRTHALDRTPLRFASSPDASLARYLAREEGLLRITPAVAALAASLRREEPLATLRAFWDFAFERLTVGPVRYDELDRDDPLSSAIAGRWVDCFIVSSLLAALCRSVGLPARLVAGAILLPSELGPHYWLEVCLPPHGWVPFDFEASVLAAGDRSDSRWAMSMFGRLPHHLVLYRLPQAQVLFGLRLPPAWYSVKSLDDGMVATRFYDRATGALWSTDRFECAPRQ